MLWVALLGLETGKHLSCQHQFPLKTLGGLFCLPPKWCQTSSHSVMWWHYHFGKGTRPYPWCGSASSQTSENPKALCIYGLTVHSLTFLWLPRPTQNSTAAIGLHFTGSHRFSGRKRNQKMGCDIWSPDFFFLIRWQYVGINMEHTQSSLFKNWGWCERIAWVQECNTCIDSIVRHCFIIANYYG